MIMLPCNIPTCTPLLDILGFGNLVLISSLIFVQHPRQKKNKKRSEFFFVAVVVVCPANKTERERELLEVIWHHVHWIYIYIWKRGHTILKSNERDKIDQIHANLMLYTLYTRYSIYHPYVK